MFWVWEVRLCWSLMFLLKICLSLAETSAGWDPGLIVELPRYRGSSLQDPEEKDLACFFLEQRFVASGLPRFPSSLRNDPTSWDPYRDTAENELLLMRFTFLYFVVWVVSRLFPTSDSNFS